MLVTSLTKLVNWGRSNSVWPCTFGLACCALEMIASTLANFDISRFGSEVFRPSPRQSDLIIIAGTLTKKMSVMVKRIYDQMADPKWVIAMGACASCGGIFKSYSVVQGVDQIIPVDVLHPRMSAPPRSRTGRPDENPGKNQDRKIRPAPRLQIRHAAIVDRKIEMELNTIVNTISQKVSRFNPEADGPSRYPRNYRCRAVFP